MKKVCVVWLLLLAVNPLFSFQTEEDLKAFLDQKVDAVVLDDFTEFEITSINSAIQRVKFKVLVLDSDADNLAQLVASYDKQSKLKIENATVHDISGKRIYSLKKSDIIDRSYVPGGTIYQDDRLKIVDLSRTSYPYIAEYSYTKEFDYLFHIPSFRLYPQEKVAVLKADYIVKSSIDLEPRFKQLNVPDSVYSRITSTGVVVNTWSFGAMKAPEEFFHGRGAEENFPMVLAAPGKFEYDGYSGDFSTWNGFGQWIGDLNKGKDDLSEEIVDKLKNLTANASSRKEKIKLVYDYLQQNTRYVSVQLGIGGYQPFPASQVNEKGFGDCKGLSNYAKAMLAAIGIESNYALIYGGRNPPSLFEDFPMSRFNHAILAVPNQQDTVWLECTSQTNPFGYLGSFTGDRDALLITDKGAKIVHTPVYTEYENVESNKTSIAISKSGVGAARTEITLSGLSYEKGNLHFLHDKGEKDRREWVYNNAPFKDFNLVSYGMELEKGQLPQVKVHAEYELPKYARKTGNRLFFDLNPFAYDVDQAFRTIYKSDKSEVFEQKFGLTKIDTVEVFVPEGVRFEFVPENSTYEDRYGSISTQVSQEEGKITFYRKLVLKKGKFPVEAYDDYRKFLGEVKKYENAKVVLNSTT